MNREVEKTVVAEKKEKKKREGRFENIEAYTIDKLPREKQAEIRSKGGKARVEQRRQQKSMREYAKLFGEMQAMGNAQVVLDSMGVAKNDQTNIAAVVLKLYQRAMTGDVMAIKLLQDMLGEEFNPNSITDSDANVIEMKYPQIALPDNGRNDPPKNILLPQAGPQTTFMASSADIVIYGGAAGGGKAMPLDEPILTKNGFVPNGSLKIGDYVCTPDGKESKIIGIFPQGDVPIFCITFIDGGQTRCTADHLWYSRITKESSDKWENRTTSEIINLLSAGKRVVVPLCEPVEYNVTEELPIAPYTFGAILGDGSITTFPVTISKPDGQLFYEIQNEGFEIKKYYRSDDMPTTYAIRLDETQRDYIKAEKLNVKSECKHIPTCYLMASVSDRVALLQGLMDTDGYADERGHCTYATTSYQLARDVQQLVWSLGGKATITPKKAGYKKDGEYIQCNDSYELYIQTKDNTQLFRLQRKKNRCVNKAYNGGHGTVLRRIIKIEPCGHTECQCIKLEDPKGLYIAKDFIVTHNTYAMLLEGLRHRNVKNFGGVIFRKNYNQITSEGGLWDASHKIYDQVEGAEAKKTPNLHWEFPGGGRLGFAYLEREEDLQKWMGSEICFLGFDELTHFSRHQFTYMLSRNRSTCGIKPYVRATCNPDADSWVASFIEWWINPDTGYPIKERSGQIRWMIMLNDVFYWGDSPQELADKYNVNVEDCKSVTFIASRLEDNKALMQADPGYMANLKAMTELDRERLLEGNWKIKAAAGRYFKRTQIKPEQILTEIPKDLSFVCRAWDYAATDQSENGDADYTAGVMIGRRKNGRFVVLDVINVQVKAGDVGMLIASTAKRDYALYGLNYMVRIAQDPGAAGKIVAQAFIKMLAGFNVKAETVSGSKENRATPFAAQWQNGNVDIVAAGWNDMYFSQLESFPESAHDDMVDASADAFNECAEVSFDISNLL